jgi:hypothetical protein
MRVEVIILDGVRSLYWHCPGCDCSHIVAIEGKDPWTWNEDVSRPTISPSVHYGSRDPSHGVCHFVITDGRVTFCGDSTHHLTGQTIELPELT